MLSFVLSFHACDAHGESSRLDSLNLVGERQVSVPDLSCVISSPLVSNRYVVPLLKCHFVLNDCVMSSQHVDSPTNHEAIISVATWFLAVSTVLSFITRMGTKLVISRRVNGDDVVIFAALLFSIGQSIAISFQASLNRPIDGLNDSQLQRFQQSAYAAELLYIPSLCLAKLSVALLLRSITPSVPHNRFIFAIGVTTVLWAASSELSVAFQCHLPNPWRFFGNTCVNRKALWNAVGAVNILTDIALILLPFAIVWRLQVSMKRKVVVGGCFAARTLVVVATVAQLFYFDHTSDSQDPTLDFWSTAVCTQVVQNLSIITACVPYLKPFFESLESGMIRSDDLRRRGMKFPYAFGSGKSAGSTTQGQSLTPSRLAKPPETAHELRDIPSTGNLGFGNHANATTITATRDDWDDGSETSQSKIIRQTTTWTVNAEP